MVRVQNKRVKKYIYAIGRRKTSTAILKLYPVGKGNLTVILRNRWEDWKDKKIPLKEFFGGNKYLLEDALYPFYLIDKELENKIDAEIVVKGGGIRWQAEAIRLAFARALVEYNPEYRSILKAEWLLKRDPREKERKKYGLKKARRAPQWSKR